MQHLRDHDLWPDTDAAVFSQHGGNVHQGSAVTLSNPNSSGTLYYTMDGSDPRQTGGAVASGALVYSAPVSLTQSAVISARVLDDGEWSPISSPEFIVDLPPPSLRITELMYHASDPIAAEILAGVTDKDQLEYLELRNVVTLLLI